MPRPASGKLVVPRTPASANQTRPRDELLSPVSPAKDAVSMPDPDVAQFAQTPRLARMGSPRRPMSAQVAFRKEARGVPLRKDIFIAPTIMFAQRLGVHPRPLPLFPDQSKFLVAEDPREKLVEVLVALVDALEIKAGIDDASDGLGVGNDKKSKRHVRPKAPVGIKMFVRPKDSLAAKKKPAGDDVDIEVDALDRKIMDQTRKLSAHLQDVWAGEVTLCKSEAETVAFLIKERLVPTLDKRIYRLNEIISDMMPEGVTELKETPQSAPRDLISFEAELEKREATRVAIVQDLKCITTKMIAVNHYDKERELHRSAVKLRMQSAKLKIDAKRLASGAAGLDTRDDKAHYIARIISLLNGHTAKSKMEGVQLVGMEGVKVLKRATSQDAKELRESFVNCCFTPKYMAVRKAALPLLLTEGILFNFVPVRQVPPKPETNNIDPAARDSSDYDIINSDNDWLSELFRRAERSSLDVQHSFIGEIYKLVRIDDHDKMQQLRKYLASPAESVRVAAVRSLAAHTSGQNSLETLQAVAALETDPEWTVRAAICEALPNIASMLSTLVAREVVQPYEVQVTQEHYDLLKGGQGAEADIDPAIWDEMAMEQERKAYVHTKFKTGMRQAMRYSTREKEMRKITIRVLENLLTDKSSSVRRSAIRIYAKVGKPGTRHAVSIILAGCKDESAAVRATAFSCLPSIVNRQPPDEDVTIEWKFEKKATTEV
jgi:hypothetical protein